ncbi:hypothetical protein [Chitinilyticum litopenaei]|uniref:hypothetical protein n=1 Tax=Chitinilyticum litopenaei TaxID=1121276 RepID=UPI001B7FEFEB|nr:hypothetical protein [Chitinilyticum litopenaei]
MDYQNKPAVAGLFADEACIRMLLGVQVAGLIAESVRVGFAGLLFVLLQISSLSN